MDNLRRADAAGVGQTRHALGATRKVLATYTKYDTHADDDAASVGQTRISHGATRKVLAAFMKYAVCA